MMSIKTRPSKLNRIAACPASAWREAEIGEGPDSPEAKEGRAIHAAVERIIYGKATARLNAESMQVAQACVFEYLSISAFYFGKLSVALQTEVPVKIPPIEGSGTLDLVGHCLDAAILIDWKTGRAEPDFEVINDYQFWAYVVGLFTERPELNTIHALRFHPRLFTDNRRSQATFVRDHLPLYTDTLAKIRARAIEAAEHHDIPAFTVPGEAQCKYCAARGNCQAHLQYVIDTSTELAKIASQTVAVSPDDMARILSHKPQLNAANRLFKIVEDAARAHIEQHGDLVDETGNAWTLKPGRKMRKVTDTLAAMQRCATRLPDHAIADCITLSVPKLDTTMRSDLNTTAKAAKAEVAELLGGLIDVVENKPSVVPGKPQIQMEQEKT